MIKVKYLYHIQSIQSQPSNVALCALRKKNNYLFQIIYITLNSKVIIFKHFDLITGEIVPCRRQVGLLVTKSKLTMLINFL